MMDFQSSSEVEEVNLASVTGGLLSGDNILTSVSLFAAMRLFGPILVPLPPPARSLG